MKPDLVTKKGVTIPFLFFQATIKLTVSYSPSIDNRSRKIWWTTLAKVENCIDHAFKPTVLKCSNSTVGQIAILKQS